MKTCGLSVQRLGFGFGCRVSMVVDLFAFDRLIGCDDECTRARQQ